MRKNISFHATKTDTSCGILLRILLLLSGIESNPGPLHDENRGKVCSVCYLKADRLLNSEQEVLVKLHIDPGYDSNHQGLPKGICMKCRCILAKENVSYKQTEKQKELATAAKVKWLRSKEGETCSCYICKVAMSFGGSYKALINEILMKKKVSTDKNRACTKCFTILYSGCSHVCTKTQMKKNIKGKIDMTTKEEIANEVIKVKLDESPKDNGVIAMKLRTGGRPSMFSVKRGRIQKRVLKKSTVMQSKVSAGLSDNQVKKLLQEYRQDLGQDGIESGIRESLIEKNKMFQGFFTTEQVLMKVMRQNMNKTGGDKNHAKTNINGKKMSTLMVNYLFHIVMIQMVLLKLSY